MKKYKRRLVGSTLEITPLIDLVFLLLIFFLVATTTSNIKSIKIDIPKAETGVKTDNEKIIISIDKQNKIFIDSQKFTLNELEKYLKTLNKDKIFQINGDKKSSYDTIIKVMDLLRRYGYNKIILGVNSY